MRSIKYVLAVAVLWGLVGGLSAFASPAAKPVGEAVGAAEAADVWAGQYPCGWHYEQSGIICNSGWVYTCFGYWCASNSRCGYQCTGLPHYYNSGIRSNFNLAYKPCTIVAWELTCYWNVID